MINLDLTTRKLQVVLAGAITTNQLPVVVSYQDVTPVGIMQGTQLKNTNSTTAVDICDAPPVPTSRRQVMTITIENNDSASSTVTVRLNESGTSYIIATRALAVGETLQYHDGFGWSKF